MSMIPKEIDSNFGQEGQRPNVEKIIAVVAHARVPVLGVGIPGFAGELVGVV